LTYRFGTAAVAAAPKGSVSFDGVSAQVGTSGAVKLPVGPRLSHIGDIGDGVMQIVVEDDSFSDTSAYELETSTDLRTWRSGGSFVNGPGAAFIREEASATDEPRFYRAKRVR
jgi:hypothetical protein